MFVIIVKLVIIKFLSKFVAAVSKFVSKVFVLAVMFEAKVFAAADSLLNALSSGKGGADPGGCLAIDICL